VLKAVNRQTGEVVSVYACRSVCFLSVLHRGGSESACNAMLK
jgi:hypothetical protein